MITLPVRAEPAGSTVVAVSGFRDYERAKMPLKTESVEEPSLNLTPMIDIVFLLIIFFMVGTQFAQMERDYDVSLPTVSTPQPLTNLPDEIVVNVHADGEIVVENESLSPAELEEMLARAKANYEDQAVIVRGHAEGPYQHVIRVLEICEQAEINTISLAHRFEPEDGGE